MGDNYALLAEACKLSMHDITRLARNSLEASFTSGEERKRHMDLLDEWLRHNQTQ